jgi:hypothetical protein
MTTNPTSPASAYSSDGCDQVFSDFFKNEMPHPWPGPLALTSVEPAHRRVETGNRSRYTLAASVAVLLGLGAYLSSGSPTNYSPATQPGLLKNAGANGGKLLENANPKAADHDPMSIPEMP